MAKSIVYNEDCMIGMARYPDKYFSLAIVDPPYGIGEANGKRMLSRHHSQAKYKHAEWDNEPPSIDYFAELMRVSQNQIIWGANHFISRIPYDSPCWIAWDKDRFSDFADGELAWTSFKSAVRYYKFTWDGFRKQQPEDRIHPTQKPVALYDWIISNYTKMGGVILDTHVGSGSSRIAADRAGLDFVGFEIDKDYWDGQENRFKIYKSQLKLF